MSNTEGVPKFITAALGQYERETSPERHADTSTSNRKRSPKVDERKEPASKRSRASLKVDDSEESTAAADVAAAAAAADDDDVAPSQDEDESKKPAAAQDKKKGGGDAAAASVDDDTEEMVDFEKMQFTFPERLMDLLQSGSVEPAMRWLPRGEAFAVVPKIFYDVVLLCHFQGTKFESFTRKLNRWGFKRLTGRSVPQECIAYHHPLFKKDKPELLKMMRSGRNKYFVPAEVGGIAAKGLAAHQQQQQREAALGGATKNSPLFDFLAACKMGAAAASAPAAPSAIQPAAGLLSNSARARLGAQLSLQDNAGGDLNQRMLDEILRYQALQSSQQLLLPGSVAGLGATISPLQREAFDGAALSLRQLLASQQEQQEQQMKRDNENLRKLLAAQQQEQQNVASQWSRENESLLQLPAAQQQEQQNAVSQRSRDNESLRQLLAAQQQQRENAASQRNSGNNNKITIGTNPFANLDAQQFLASYRATTTDADLRLRQLLSQASATSANASAQSTQDQLSAAFGLQLQGSSQHSSDAATAATAINNTPTDSQLLQLLFLQEQMERNRGGP